MNRTSEYDFTIIVPVYDEAGNIFTIAQRLDEFKSHCQKKTCILFVDDGSTDGSKDMIEKECSLRKDFYYISFSYNCGLSAALKAGIDYTFSPLLGYIDADMQTDPEDFSLLLEHIGSCSMVTGFRARRQDNVFKKIQSRIANSFRRFMTGDGAVDTGCPLKVIRTSVAKKFPLFKGMHRFLPALVLLQEGGSYKQIAVRHYPRKAGVSKFSLANRFWGPFADCFVYRWMRSRCINYKVSSDNINTAL